MKSVFTVLVLLLFAVGCRTRSHNDSLIKSAEQRLVIHGGTRYTPGSVVTSPPQITYVYHWTDDAFALKDPGSYITKAVEGAFEKNKSWDANDTLHTEAGYGLYAANDAVSTKRFGKYLVVIPVKPKMSFRVKKSSEDIKVNEHALLYPYGGGVRTKNGDVIGHAIVFRSTESIELSQAKTYTFRGAEPCDFKRKPSKIFVASESLHGVIEKNIDGFLCLGAFYVVKLGLTPEHQKVFGPLLAMMQVLDIEFLKIGDTSPEKFSPTTVPAYAGPCNFRKVTGMKCAEHIYGDIYQTFAGDELAFERVREGLAFLGIVDRSHLPSDAAELLAQIKKKYEAAFPSFGHNMPGYLEFYDKLLVRMEQQGMTLWK